MLSTIVSMLMSSALLPCPKESCQCMWVVQPQGLSGGVVAVYPDKKATFKAEENIIVGNVCLYGAVKVCSHLCKLIQPVPAAVPLPSL